ncbi:hypothetical protein [Flavobacterium hungaricum]|uniref:Uncharacterized protein n=1 Tax=Flavobacterium hungaricum TaxID=2082725 RepID=A0ABR9TGK0_9FLAO|nr:hypothetical protein [Flavobacterium hungaricum]MBE8724469.1 hypothetical protein [Flavobacterium hungaricum]
MKSNKLEKMSFEELTKKKDQIKGIAIACGVVYILSIILLLYLSITKGFAKLPIAVYIPLFGFPGSLMPLMVYLISLNKEIKSRG